MSVKRGMSVKSVKRGMSVKSVKRGMSVKSVKTDHDFIRIASFAGEATKHNDRISVNLWFVRILALVGDMHCDRGVTSS